MKGRRPGGKYEEVGNIKPRVGFTVEHTTLNLYRTLRKKATSGLLRGQRMETSKTLNTERTGILGTRER